jgi:hypothetical protein
MAKRSIATAIRMKQSSAYRSNRSSAPSIHQIDGSSRREVSGSRIKALESWTIRRAGGGSDQADEQAERIMNQGYSRYSNPICDVCYVQKALNGSCFC